jgi:hypothetical protein
MGVFRPVVEQQEYRRICRPFHEQVEERVRLFVDPMQVFEDKHERLIQALAQKEALNRILGPAPPDLRIHLRKRIVALDDTEQCEPDGARCRARGCGRESLFCLQPFPAECARRRWA